MALSQRADESLTHADLLSATEMHTDAVAVRDRLGLDRVDRLERAARAAVRPAPRLTYDAFPREVAKPEVRVGEAAARIADALHLHLD